MDYERSVTSEAVRAQLVTRWWVDPIPGRDAYALYVVRYTVEEPEGTFIRSDHLTENGWEHHEVGEVIEPVAIVSGHDAITLAYTRDPKARERTADVITSVVKDAITAALKGQS